MSNGCTQVQRLRRGGDRPDSRWSHVVLRTRACLTSVLGLVGQARFVSERDVLTDEMWAQLEPLLPDRSPRRGRPWIDHRPVLEAIMWRFRTGAPWRDLPAEFPAWQTVWHRFNAWSGDGTFDRILQVVQGRAQAAGEVDWTVSVDATIARAHQHAAGAPDTEKGGWIELQEFLARTG